jgi:hypothetical protein
VNWNFFEAQECCRKNPRDRADFAQELSLANLEFSAAGIPSAMEL